MQTLMALNPIALQVGALRVRWYGVIITSGVIIALFLSMREAKRRQLNPDHLVDLLLWMLPFALLGARTYYVAFRWSYYQQHLNEIIKIWDGGIAIYGALIAGVIVLAIFCSARNLPVWLILDIVAPTVILAQGMGRWGNFMNQEAFGAKTTLAFLQSLHLPHAIINQMLINGAYRQPTFLYESIWDVLGFIVLMSLRHKEGLFKRGEVFLSYVMWYAFGRFFVEGMRTDSLYMMAGLRVSQVLSVVFFVIALAIVIMRRKSEPMLKWYLDGNR